MWKKVKFQINKRYKGLVFQLCASNHPLYRWYYRFFYRPAPHSLAWWLNAYGQLIPALKVLQIGANDGFNHDPIVKFIKKYRWQGVLLEPQPWVHARYLSRLHLDNPNIHTVNAALDVADGERSMYHIAISKERWATGLSSFEKAALYEAIDSGHVAKQAAKQGLKLPATTEALIESTKIRCISPATLMQQYGLHTIDLLQIDAEGYDWQIIRMMEVGRTRPGMIVFEYGHLTETDRAACHHTLTTLDYELIHTSADTIALQKALLTQLQAAGLLG